MSVRSSIAPSTLEVDLVEGGIVVRYLDGREVFYHGPPERAEPPVRTPPGKDVHVLVTGSDGLEGVMTYVNDRKTHDDILEASGVGRVVLDREESATIFPGIDVEAAGYSIRVEADLDVVDGRVFVFAEDEMSERAYELVKSVDATERGDAGAGVDGSGGNGGSGGEAGPDDSAVDSGENGADKKGEEDESETNDDGPADGANAGGA